MPVLSSAAGNSSRRSGKPASLYLLAIAMLLVSCQDQLTEPPPQAADSSFSISDARAGAVAQRNPGFFWLPPAAPQPKSAELGTFHESLQPAVEVVCQARLRDGSPVDDAECDGDDVIVRYTRDDGLGEEDDHYAFHLNPGGLDAGAGSETFVYRIIAYTDPLTELGGPFQLGHLDFRLERPGARRGGPSGDDGDILSVNPNRTLPVRFRIDRGAYEWELVSNGATAPNEPGAPLCEVNCSVTVIDPEEETEASLTDPETGEEVTAVLFPPGALDESAVLVIDERTTEGPDATCAPGYAPAGAASCFRYVITYTDPFNVDVPFGICPSEEVELGEGTLWDLVKVDYDDDEPVVSFPPAYDASPFLPCGEPTGTPIGFLHRFLDWLVPAAYAGDTRVWGGTVRDFSDILWAIDAELTMDPLPESATSGSTIPVRARWVAMHPTLHDEDPVGIEGAAVTFTVGAGGGELLPPEGVQPVDVVLDPDNRSVSITLLTDTEGYAAAEWRVYRGRNTVGIQRAIEPDGPEFLAVAEGLGSPYGYTYLVGPWAESYAWRVNNHGVVLGAAREASTDPWNGRILWQDGTYSILPAPEADVAESAFASALNNEGQIVGAYFADESIRHVLLWENGAVTDLGHPVESLPYLYPEGINGSGVIVGYSYEWDAEDRNVEYFTSIPWLWQPGSGFEILPMPGTWARATAINEDGTIAGHGDVQGFNTAFRWHVDGTLEVIPLPDALEGGAMEPYAINSHGHMAGFIGDMWDPDIQQYLEQGVFLYTNATSYELAPGRASGIDLNDHGITVGYTRNLQLERWEAWIGQPHARETLIVPSRGGLAYAIGNDGLVAGYGWAADGRYRALLWWTGQGAAP